MKKRLLLIPAVLLALSGTALANNNPHPDCHGMNQVICRPDPQPDHGQDCLHSDDHRCDVVPTPTPTPPVVVDVPGTGTIVDSPDGTTNSTDTGVTTNTTVITKQDLPTELPKTL